MAGKGVPRSSASFEGSKWLSVTRADQEGGPAAEGSPGVGLWHGGLQSPRVRLQMSAADVEGCDHAPVNDEQILRRPIGWWLKEADSRLDAAFDSTLHPQGVDRRGWQVLATLARSSTRRVDVVAALAAFDEPTIVEGVVDEFRRRGWVEESAGVLRLTPVGAQQQEALAPLVERVRHQVAAALPEDDYLILVRLLARLVAGLPERSR